MYTDEDLDNAIKSGIFTEEAIAKFRQQISSSQNTVLVDEENFRLISSFNDIFVVIACVLLLSSILVIFTPENNNSGYAIFTLLSWGLSEFFVRYRKMALPAIVLLLAFIGGSFAFILGLFVTPTEISYIPAAAISAIAAFLHWQRFRVPITVAAGTAAIVGFVIASILSIIPNSKEWVLVPLFICGVASFIFAMYWDTSDRSRVTRKSDVAFWLHLLAAPLIIHPVFYSLGILEGNVKLGSILLVICLYFFMTFISIIIDRRAFMVSSLIYVLYAISKLFEVYGSIAHSFAITGIVIGSALLFLSAFWHSARTKILLILPKRIQESVPVIKLRPTH